MRKESIKTHLKEYSIYNKRKTTINHAFASALSVPDDYDEKLIDDFSFTFMINVTEILE